MREIHHSRDPSESLAEQIANDLRNAVETFNAQSPALAQLTQEENRWAFRIVVPGMDLRPEYFGGNGSFTAATAQPRNPLWSIYRTLKLVATEGGALIGSISETKMIPVNQGGRR